MHRSHGCRRGLIGRGSAAEGRVAESLRREVTCYQDTFGSKQKWPGNPLFFIIDICQ